MKHKRQQWFGSLWGCGSASALTVSLELCSRQALPHKKPVSVVCVSLRPVFWAQKITETKQKILSPWSQLDPFRYMDSLGTQHVCVLDTNHVCGPTTASFTQTVLGLLLVLKNVLFKANLTVPIYLVWFTLWASFDVH